MCEKDGKPVAGMMQAMEGMPVAWQSYVTVDDIDATAARVEGAGGSVLQAPVDVTDAGRMAVFADPNGAVISSWQPKQHIGAQLVNEHGTLNWNELMSPDIDRAAAFYAEIFGWKAEPFPGMDYTVFNDSSGAGIAGAMKPPMEGMPSFWGIYFAVDDCDVIVAAAEKAGGGVMMPATDMEGVGRMSALTDPQGGMFSVMTPAPQAG
jgi:predicted enzyme related to lactoylglutathione lyase